PLHVLRGHGALLAGRGPWVALPLHARLTRVPRPLRHCGGGEPVRGVPQRAEPVADAHAARVAGRSRPVVRAVAPHHPGVRAPRRRGRLGCALRDGTGARIRTGARVDQRGGGGTGDAAGASPRPLTRRERRQTITARPTTATTSAPPVSNAPTWT